MIDPALALQTALHSHLVAQPTVSALVPAMNIRAGSSRPDNFPGIQITAVTTVFNGRAAGGQYVANVFTDLHVWTLADGLDAAKQIASTVASTLIDWPDADGFEFDAFELQRVVYPRDPDKDCGHAVMSIEATIRWRL